MSSCVKFLRQDRLIVKPLRGVMVKQRFSTSDVAAEVGCLRRKALGMRLANLYDINAKVLPGGSVTSMKMSICLKMVLHGHDLRRRTC